MKSVTLRRQGGVYTMFVDPVTQAPLTPASFDDEPVGGFPVVLHRDEVEALRSQGVAVTVLEAQRPAQPTLTYSADVEARAAREAGEAGVAKAPLVQPPAAPAEPGLRDQLLRAFEDLVFVGSQDDAEVVGSFLVGVSPSFESELREAAAQAERRKLAPVKRFKL